MIWNRPSNLWMGAFTALLNVIVIAINSLGVYKVPPELVASMNIALGAAILLIAYQPPVVNTEGTVIVKTNNGHTDKRITFNESGNATTTSIPDAEHPTG